MIPQFAPSPIALPPVELPGALNYHHDIDPGRSSGLNAAKAMMKTALADAIAFNTRRGMVDETITAAANLAAVSKLADKIADKTLAAYDAAVAEMALSISQAERDLHAATELRPNGNASEVRSVLRSMPTAQRQKSVADAFRDHDREIIAAVVDQNALLHGVNPKLIADLYQAFKREAAPLEFALLADHRKAERYLAQARPSLLSWMARMHEGTRSHAARKATYDAVIASHSFDG